MTTYTQKFGQFVQMRRLEIGMTQKELSQQIAKVLDIDYISKLETGKKENITFAKAEQILEALNAEMIFKGRE